MAFDKLPDDKGEKRGAVIDMTWHRKKREAELVRMAHDKRHGATGAAAPWKMRLAHVAQGLAVLFGILVLFKGCGAF
jgi:hypothetical protein